MHLKILDLKGSVLQEIRATDAEETGDHTLNSSCILQFKPGIHSAVA
ncbi:MAG: hypothetical protein IPI30_06580 [Saprospiraceae bacterium]|nr:hypothetical protein [Candidatus Vicinibacter affinis]